jgi:transitional endoplasmic reticulum ATPase
MTSPQDPRESDNEAPNSDPSDSPKNHQTDYKTEFNFDGFSGGLGGLVDEVKQLLNLDQLVDLAQKLEEKAQSGELQTQVHFSTRPLSSIPRRGSIPRNQPRGEDSSFQPKATRYQPSTNDSGSSPQPGSNSNFNSSNPNSNRQTSHNRKDSGSTPRNQGNSGKPPVIAELVGGLGDVLAQLRDLVEIPLKRPDILAQLGLEPPRGVLLVGPPGTGKTLVARSLAQTLGVSHLAVVAPELMGKYYGEAEARLRQVFQEAVQSAPCLLFIDEIDALVPNRNQVEGEVEKRLVAQMLGLMDGFAADAAQGVIVLAATNRPDALDPALRRPGRFDREIVFPVPDRQGRQEILAIHTRTMPLAADVDLTAIAEQAHGFVGADLKGLCQSAALHALKRQVSTVDAIPDQLEVNAADFNAAQGQIQPAVLRSVQIQSPNVPWDAVGGLATIKETLQEAIAGALLVPELYAHAKATAAKGILLYGPPGTGKTLLAKAVATAAQANFITVAGPEVLTKWVGASEQALRQLFTQARQAAPCVIFIDEIDTLAPSRGSYQGDSGVSDRVIGQLLTELDGIRARDGVLLIAATNRKESLDPALLRAGRLELHLKVDLPDETARLAILQVHNQGRPLATDLDLTAWAAATEGWNGADLAFLSNRAAIFAIRRHQAIYGAKPNINPNINPNSANPNANTASVEGDQNKSDQNSGILDNLASLLITTADYEQAFGELSAQRQAETI